MCGRKYDPDGAAIERAYRFAGPRDGPFVGWRDLQLNFDARPTQMQPVLRLGAEGGWDPGLFRWGLVPSWWKQEKLPANTFNATAEKIKAKSGMWWTPFLRQRCLVPIRGFYEWQLQSDGKTRKRHFIKLRDTDIFTLAGLWDAKKQPDGTTLYSYTIVTCPANALMARIHNDPKNSDGPRMPVILAGETAKAWVDPASGVTPAERLALLQPFAQEALLAYPVVNNPVKADKSDLIEPIGEPVEA